MFQECSSSTPIWLVNLYELDEVFYYEGASHFGSSLPFPSILAVQMRTTSPSSNSLGDK
jgi:hypothetical protein